MNHRGRVDGSRAGTRQQVLAAIGRALQFPDYYGQNLDALDELITDLGWLPPGPVELVWSDPDVLRSADPAGYRAVLQILRDAERATRGTERPLTVRFTPGRP
jgi:RNAse (barnase) inhibitor barstar